MNDADDVLAHSEDEDEDDEPVVVERRPSGTQVLSARIPSDLAMTVLAESARRGVPLSAVVRDALDDYFAGGRIRGVTTFAGFRVHVFRESSYDTANPVVTRGDLPALRLAV